MKLIIALVLVVIGVAGGGALGMMLKPDAKPEMAAEGGGDAMGDETKTMAKADMAPKKEMEPDEDPTEDPAAYVTIARQMIVPVVSGGETQALMLFEIALDVPEEHREVVLEREPRLRDAFLRELFELSYTGAFLETYTSDRVMEDLRQKLLAAARVHVGDRVTDILILDALRQEL
ncbi:MAG: flagellar basal body-associated FliL family protein [Pseudomonadota bacterium]